MHICVARWVRFFIAPWRSPLPPLDVRLQSALQVRSNPKCSKPGPHPGPRTHTQAQTDRQTVHDKGERDSDEYATFKIYHFTHSAVAHREKGLFGLRHSAQENYVQAILR